MKNTSTSTTNDTLGTCEILLDRGSIENTTTCFLTVLNLVFENFKRKREFNHDTLLKNYIIHTVYFITTV